MNIIMELTMNNLIISMLDEMETKIQTAIKNEYVSKKSSGVDYVDKGMIQGLIEAQRIVKGYLKKFKSRF